MLRTANPSIHRSTRGAYARKSMPIRPPVVDIRQACRLHRSSSSASRIASLSLTWTRRHVRAASPITRRPARTHARTGRVESLNKQFCFAKSWSSTNRHQSHLIMSDRQLVGRWTLSLSSSRIRSLPIIFRGRHANVARDHNRRTYHRRTTWKQAYRASKQWPWCLCARKLLGLLSFHCAAVLWKKERTRFRLRARAWKLWTN